MEKSIDMADFYNLYQDGGLNVLDVREPDEFESGHIPGAQNYPLSRLEEEAAGLDKNTHYYVICLGGGRAKKASDYLNNLGYQTTYVTTGMNNWPGDVEK